MTHSPWRGQASTGIGCGPLAPGKAVSSGLGGFLERGLEEQDVFEHGLQELLLVLGQLKLEQSAGVLLEAFD